MTKNVLPIAAVSWAGSSQAGRPFRLAHVGPHVPLHHDRLAPAVGGQDDRVCAVSSAMKNAFGPAAVNARGFDPTVPAVSRCNRPVPAAIPSLV